MQKAQRIIRAYRRRRLILCFALALLALLLTLGIRYLADRKQYQHDTTRYAARAVETIEELLVPLDAARAALLPLVGMPCLQVHRQLREMAASLQTVRSIALVNDGILYCSSIFGERNVPVHQLQPHLPAPNPLMRLSRDSSLIKGSPVLILWTPSLDNSQSGVLQSVNIEFIASLLLNPAPPVIEHVLFDVAGKHLEYGRGLTETAHASEGLTQYQQTSERYPFSVTLLGPSPDALALKNLPGQLPLAVLLSLLIGYIAWLATARRMSFSWEINLGIANNEFEVYCQPLVSGKTGECTGVELLLRWNNPRLGPIAPDVFIPLAEQLKLINALTRYVLIKTVAQRHYFPASADFHIGVNIAASHFHEGVIIDDLKRYWYPSCPVQPLFLELTERDALPEVDYRVAHDLRQLGVKLAIDDFGTGQSSLSYLETLSPDVLKMDKRFTAAIGTDAVNSTVTDIIIAMARRLKIELVAEGVETEEQAAYLCRLGVPVLQGYLFARPMPLSELPQWLEQRRAHPGTPFWRRRLPAPMV
ncbi:EAL domain-containing protein [Cronobacter turicensis]|uniref:EAL domain-containing protein n=1 Tax=Cronobacter turicensis TaxID=413502 RepID=UPI000CFD30D8|nr:EAL domain-containing protein [Cronobacter turicensis]EGT4491619.1 EAL domain-containing protein [Cronobacter turicensis]ELY4322515.1 EAL domain-containing protein [Cronobacter turicensis]ELY4523138.1 EAL domain-containing protein [Cronobacter turicensis]ELY4573630.1 EAL domain-containing protein [Cronobacter turicensis]ELY4606377.1 EAL domain-containing protein [Cronobacter turicensis]